MDIMSYSGGTIKSIAEGIIEKCLNAIGIVGKLRLLLRQVNFGLSFKINYADLQLDTVVKLFNTTDPDGEWKLLEYALELLAQIALREKKHVVVFFDEFSELLTFGDRAIKIFRSKLQLQENISCLFAGSQESLMTKIFISTTGAFYRFGQLVYLDELDNADVITYLRENFPQLEPQAIDACMELLHGHPYYTATIIDHLIYKTDDGKDIGNVHQYVQDTLMTQERSYIELQMAKIKERNYALEITRLIALGLNPYSEMTNISEQQTYHVLRDLELMGYLRKKSRGEYKIVDPLLELFLRS